MTLRERLSQLFSPEVPDRRFSDIKAVTNYAPWSGGPPLSSMSQEPQVKAAKYLQVYKVGWFNKAERKISGDFANLDWSVSSGDSESDDTETELPRPDLDLPFDSLSPIDQFQRLMERPNPNQTGVHIRRKLQIRRDFAGTGMWYLEGGLGGGLPTAIYGISPARMWPARDREGVLIGWVMDKDSQSPTPFDASEIVNFPQASAEDGDGDLFGVGVVEAVWSQVPLTDLIARHTTDLLTTGGRLAGMLWPKDRTLTEDEFVDAQRAWRNVASDSNAARRLLLFPEPMEWAAGASTPAEIGLPELAELNRDEILTTFPISAHMLGIPHAAGLNASGEVRREERRDYWEGTQEPRVTEFKEVVQTQIISRYEEATGQTFDFDVPIPNLDDAPTLIEKADAVKALWALGFDEKEAIAAANLDHIKWIGKPAPIMPPPVEPGTPPGGGGPPPPEPPPAKATKSRESVTDAAVPYGHRTLEAFFAEQKARVSTSIRRNIPTNKAARKADTGDWWDAEAEDRELKTALRGLYLEVGKGSLQVVADTLDRFVYSDAVQRILSDLLSYGGDRITDINAKTHAAIVDQLTEGTRRGYSINQLVDGFPEHSYPGVQGALLDNGVPVFDSYRAEMIARTETMLSYNRSAVTGYKDFGVKELQAIDGDEFDEPCRERNGQTFTVDAALEVEDHPNGTLDWVPILDKAAHGFIPESLEARVDGIKIDVGSPVINVHLPENVVNVPEPTVTVAPPTVTVEPAVVNVTTPDVTVNVPKSEPVIKVASPVVNVAAAEVHPTPVEVKANIPDVTVNVSPEMRIVGMPDRVTARRVERDKAGRIITTTDVETDA